MPNMLTPFQKSVIQQNKDTIIALGHFKKILKFLKEHGLVITAQELYDELYPSFLQNCEHSNFVSYSVGYRACKKGCECYVQNLSNKLSSIKQSYTSDKIQRIQQARRRTVQEKYGVDNVSKLDSVIEKISTTKKERYGASGYNNSEKRYKTNLERYGQKNPMHVPEIKSKCLINLRKRDFDSINKKIKKTKLARYNDASYRNKDKADQTNIKRYGVSNPSKSPVIKLKISKKLRTTLYDRNVLTYNKFITPLFNKEEYIAGVDNIWECNSCKTVIYKPIINGMVPRCLTCFPHTVSKFEIEVGDFIKSLGVQISTNDRTIIKPKELDIVVTNKLLAFECNGLYRHSEISGNKGKFYHIDKTTAAENKGYSLMHILDVDWYNSNKIIKSMIKNKLGLSTRVYARQCQVTALSSKESSEFFNINHLQGSVPSSISYGLYYKDKLVSAMSFSKSRYDKTVKWELLRFCSLLDHTVVGAASKLIKSFRTNNAGSIITYADRSYGTSSFYETIGFILTKTTAPGYRYVKENYLFSRIRFQKHKMHKSLSNFDPALNEWENMKANGYDRIWDCGHRAYILNS